jgi:DNA-binding NtrC family response regulator
MPHETGTILIVEDDLAVGKVLSTLLEQNQFEAVHVPSAEEALRALESRPFDLVISDVRMPGMDGIELLKVLTTKFPDLPVVLLTAHGSVPMAVDAMKAGAADFMLKPFERDEILFVVRKALTPSSATANQAPPIEPAGELTGAGIIGTSAGMTDVFATIRKVASGTATVLIRGETGTGKELVAKALHEGGARKDHPFVRVHCAALPDSLLESELFGYEKGAFTGASTRKPGRVELAHRGTLFLDEIGDITPQVQVKLLRVLQEREFERIGGTQTIKVDVRFVAATHRDLEGMVQKGQFREDLFYRLNVVSLRVPALRERGDDIEALSKHFAAALGLANGKAEISIEKTALEILRAHSWPGNVRQLQNTIERLVVLGDGSIIRKDDVERELRSNALPGSSVIHDTSSLDAHRREAEKEALENALSRAKNNRTLAARLLNVSRRTLYNKLKDHGLA